MELADYLQEQRMSQAQLAKMIGAFQPDVHRWIYRKAPVPEKHCVAIERATNGQVTRKDLRPNDWQDIWPELSQSLNGQGGQDAGADSLADKPELAERGQEP